MSKRDNSPDRDISSKQFSKECFLLNDMYICWFHQVNKLMFVRPTSTEIVNAKLKKMLRDGGTKWIEWENNILFIPSPYKKNKCATWNDTPLKKSTKPFFLPE